MVEAGFQGTSLSSSKTAEITTLGRGGSDTSAVALAKALKADAPKLTKSDLLEDEETFDTIKR